ncbi:hypothetical protein FNF31_04016 [Cafeteria roenbergensis]|uniref:C-CAP/cofactor C-like domain-containing protein n=1 Tax=Cafeteria roenbergensis TaxID=33653 RepID=A0A5A8D8J4_CAFRO|nr:hypothetical protein FNF31_04016 [Cafeteria roenbergensis]
MADAVAAIMPVLESLSARLESIEAKLGAAKAPEAEPAAAAPAPAASAAPVAGDARGALFAQLGSIDQSSGRTAGLRHVTKDMKSGGATGPVPAAAAASSAAPKPKPKFGASAKPKTKPPGTCEKRGMRWTVQNYTKADGVITVEGVAIREEVFIADCDDATIVIPDKCKAIAVDGCKKLALVFEGAVSSCEIVNCKRVKMQCKNFVPTVSIDKTDGIIVYLSEEGRKTQIVSSKSSEMNASFPNPTDPDGDMIEVPIPEQFISTITPEGKIHIEVSDLYA